jgi:hypothetical protein
MGIIDLLSLSPPRRIKNLKKRKNPLVSLHVLIPLAK